MVFALFECVVFIYLPTPTLLLYIWKKLIICTR